MHAPPESDTESGATVAAVRAAIPPQGFFAEKEWLLSPRPFPLSRKQVRELEELGQRLFLLQKAFNRIYGRSAAGKLPGWIAGALDAGKPDWLVAHGRSRAVRDEVPRVIRPDLILTEEGFALTEIDSVPGGIGLTGWLNRTYDHVLNRGGSGPSVELIGGAEGMIEGFRGILPTGADLVISSESSGYRPEMEWLAGQLNTPTGRADDAEPRWQVHAAESYAPGSRAIYRFFELFDLENIPFARKLADDLESPAEGAGAGIALTAPLKPALEEKLWSALFWLQPLREVWRRELRDSNWRKLCEIIPYSWVMDPTPLPHHGVIPRLEINCMAELADFSQKERELVLKISGFSDLAWGSRGVHLGSDLSQEAWRHAVETALSNWRQHPYVLQEFRKGKRVQHPFWDPVTSRMQIMDARVRLCPYYFNQAHPDGSLGDRVNLGGVLATIVPADKKFLHGMRDAILAPCCIMEGNAPSFP